MLFLLIADPIYATPIGVADDNEINFSRVFASLLFCVLLAVGVILVLNRMTNNHNRKWSIGNFFKNEKLSKMNVQIMERHRINPNTDLMLVEYSGHQYFIALSNNNIQLLDKNEIIIDDVMKKTVNLDA